MIRIFISVLLFYFGSMIIIASLIENKYQTSNNTLNEQIKSMLLFSAIGLTFGIIGWLAWPNTNNLNVPRYYVGEQIKSDDGIKLNVRNKK